MVDKRRESIKEGSWHQPENIKMHSLLSWSSQYSLSFSSLPYPSELKFKFPILQEGLQSFRKAFLTLLAF